MASVYVILKFEGLAIDGWPVAYADSLEAAEAFVASHPLKDAELRVSGDVLNVSDPDATKVAAGLCRAVRDEYYKGTDEEWVADLKKLGLWDGSEPASLRDLWLTEDQLQDMLGQSFAREREKMYPPRYPAIPGAD